MNEMLFIEIFLVAWVVIVGLCIGSFLNVVILRGLSGESIVFPSSKCPICNNKLKWWMNIPVLSYLLLRGKCGFCKTKISIQYPIIEAFTGFMFGLIFYKFSLSIETLFYLIATSLIIVMSVTDIKESIIFDVHAYILIAAGIILNIITGGMNGFITALLGGITGFLIYEILARSGYLFAGQRAFGEGDSFIAAGIGAFFGWKLTLLSVILSVLIMSVFTIPYFFYYSYKNGRKKTMNALISGIVFVAATFLIAKFDLIKELMGVIVYLTVLFIWGIWFVKQMMSEARQKENEGEGGFCAMPFGPAMGISFLLIMFFEQNIKTYITGYFG